MQNDIQKIRKHTRTIVRELKVLQGIKQRLGISLSQCHFLFELERLPNQNLQQLSDKLLLDNSTTSRLSASLVKAGLVEVDVPEHDQRQKQFFLTEQGKEVVNLSNQRANQQVHNALELMNKEEQMKIEEGMGLYAKALQQQRLQNKYNIRPIEPKDTEQVAQLIRKVMTEFGAVGEGYSINDPEIEDMYTAYKSPQAVFFVIEDDRSILGCGGIGPLSAADSNTCELRKMYFYPELRGAGLGKKLLALCLEKARSLGYQTCYLETISRMWQAIRLYEKVGFLRLEQPMGQTGHSSCEAYYSLDLGRK